MHSETRRAALVARAWAPVLVIVFALCGCTATLPGISDAPTPAIEQPTVEPKAPWATDNIPTVVMEFDQDGESHTLSGEIPIGLVSCSESGLIAIGSEPPDPGIGVLFSFEPDTAIVVSSWLINDDYAVQLQSTSVVSATEAERGSMIYWTVGATGTAFVLPRVADKLLISDYQFGPDDQVDATFSFIVNCPAS